MKRSAARTVLRQHKGVVSLWSLEACVGLAGGRVPVVGSTWGWRMSLEDEILYQCFPC